MGANGATIKTLKHGARARANATDVECERRVIARE